MRDLQLLKFGFVVDIRGSAIYDHVVNARMEYADALISKLKSDVYPVIARRCQAASEEGVRSPVFQYQGACNVSSTFQSAYYLSDALTRKEILPVYFPETGEVKNLMPLLDEEQKEDALAVIQILRARYIKPEIRHPEKSFLCGRSDNGNLDSETINISDEEILKIFGRLPVSSQDKHENLSSDGFISDNVARVAS